MKILHLIDSLDYSGSARQIHLLAPAFAHGNLAVDVCILGPATPWAESLRAQGIPVHALGWSRWFDPSVLWNLRNQLRLTEPTLIHVWRLPALRALAVVAPDLLPRVVMSAPLPPTGRLFWLDRQLLQRVRCLAVAGVSDQELCIRQGVVAPRSRVIPPAVARSTVTNAPEVSPSILCVGRLERAEGMRNAVWAFDLLTHMYRQHLLVFAGAGSMHAALIDLAIGMGNAPQVRFLGARADLSDLLHAAPVAWVPSAANCGRQVALEAMAAGCAVVASDVPCMRDVIVHGETGFLVPAQDVAQRARVTHRLFQDTAMLQRLGQTARQQVAAANSVSDVADRWRDLYQNVA